MIGEDVYRFYGRYALLLANLVFLSHQRGYSPAVVIGYFSAESANYQLLLIELMGDV
jgi:hypothetical protein